MLTQPIISEQITFLYTSDLEASSDFYERKLGLQLALDQGSCRIYHTAGRAYLGVCQRQAPPGASQGLIVTLVTPDVDGWYDYLTRRGVIFETQPEFNPAYHIYHCFLRDPDGYRIEIQRFQDDTWNQPEDKT